MNEAANLWTRTLSRRHRTLMIASISFAGVAGAAAATPWQFARRAGEVVEERLDRLGEPDGSFFGCPPGVSPEDTEKCSRYDDKVPPFEALAASPHVAGALLTAVISANLSSPSDPTTSVPVFVTTTPRSFGRIDEPHIVAGRAVDQLSTDEVVVSERTARALHLKVGGTLLLAPCDLRFFDANAPCDAPGPMRVVGIARTIVDLSRARPVPPGAAVQIETRGVNPTAGWFEARARQHSIYPTMSFTLAPGATLDEVTADVAAALPGWAVLATAYDQHNDAIALERTAEFEQDALMMIAVVVFLAGLVFAGQAIVRQAHRELGDAPLLRMLGFGRGMLLNAVGRRAVTLGAGAGTAAATLTLASSGFGPTGVAGRADVDRGLAVDWLVVGVAFVATCLLSGAAYVVSGSRTMRSRRARRAGNLPGWRPPLLRLLPLSAAAGLVADRAAKGRNTTRLALIATAAATATAVGAGILTASLHRVLTEPARYGATWTFGAANAESDDDAARLSDAVQRDPLITDAAFVASSGRIDLSPLPASDVIAFIPVKGDLGPAIVSGRAPTSDDEVALGPATLNELGIDVGDDLPLLPTDAGAPTDGPRPATVGPLHIVGTALLSDGDKVGPGQGLIVTLATAQQLSVVSNPLLVVRTADFDEAVARHLQSTYQGQVTVPRPQSDLANLDSVSGSPWVIAGLVGLLALGALGHALVVAIPRRRRYNATLMALGLTHTQVRRATWWSVMLLVAVASLIGATAGLIAGRLIWGLVRDDIGLGSGAVMPVDTTLAVVVAVLLISGLLTALPARRAARAFVARTLHAE